MSKKEKAIFITLVTGIWGPFFCFVGINIYQAWTGVKVPGPYFAVLLIIAVASALSAQLFYLPRYKTVSEMMQTTKCQRVVRRLYYAVCAVVTVMSVVKYFGVNIPTSVGNVAVILVGVFAFMDCLARRRTA